MNEIEKCDNRLSTTAELDLQIALPVVNNIFVRVCCCFTALTGRTNLLHSDDGFPYGG